MFIILFLIFTFSIISASASKTYYVSNQGDDSNTGESPNDAWKTIDKVDDEMRNSGVIDEGDDILFRRGDVFISSGGDAALITRDNGGTYNDWMIIGAYGTGKKPEIDGRNCNGVVSIAGWGNYTKFEDLIIHSSSGTNSPVLSLNGWNGEWHHNITVSNCEIYDSSGVGIIIADINYYTIEDCVVHDTGSAAIYIVGSSVFPAANGTIKNCTCYNTNANQGIDIHQGWNGDSYELDVGNNHLIINCTCYNTTESPFGFGTGNNIIVKNCESYLCSGGWSGLGIGHAVTNITVENCFIHDPISDGSEGIVIYNNERSGHVIIRNCVVYNSQAHSIKIVGDEASINNVMIYHNTILTGPDSENVQGIDVTSAQNLANCFIKNNIFSSTVNYGQYDKKMVRYLYNTDYPENLKNSINWEYNVWYRPDGIGKRLWWEDYGDTWFNFSETFPPVDGWNSRFPTEMWFDPELSDAINSDFTLNVTSPAIDTGGWLTTTINSGTGKIINVENAHYFIDGYGMIEGDVIKIGDNEPVEIIDVDYNNNQITIDRIISWSDTDPISFDYSASAPDVGAFEFISEDIDTITSNIAISSSEPLDTNSSFGWNNITALITDISDLDFVKLNITLPDNSFRNISMNKKENQYFYNTSSLFSKTGPYNYFIWIKFINDNPPISSFMKNFFMPSNSDIYIDRIINVLDLTLISNHYSETGKPGWIREDFDNNGVINVLDLVGVSIHL